MVHWLTSTMDHTWILLQMGLEEGDLREHFLTLGYLILTLLQIADSSSHHAAEITKMRKSVHMDMSEKANMVHLLLWCSL